MSQSTCWGWAYRERKYAEYSTFSVDDASTNYRLNVGGFSGTAGTTYITIQQAVCTLTLYMHTNP